MKINKKRIGLICGLLVIFLLVISFTMKKSSATSEYTILRNQTVNGITFENADIKKEKNNYIFSVDLYNDNTETIDIKSLTIIFKKDNQKDINIKLEDVNSLEPFEGRKIEIEVTDDIEDIDGLDYKIDKK